MTNVKLKLMFYLLNALLTADIVHARPYSENTTDIIFKFTNNASFHLPVESNSDTLIVAEEEETSEERNRNSNTHMEDIMNAEQDRDEDLSDKYMKEHKMVPSEGKEKGDVHMTAIMDAEQNRDVDISEKVRTDQKTMELPQSEDVEKQINRSSLLEKIIDAETDREETLTDISEFVPRFEYLIAAKNDSVGNKSVVSDNNLEKVDRNSSDVRKVEYVELVEVERGGENKSAYYANITGHEVENDLEPDTRFTDVQTLFLACFATLLPLLGVLFAMLLIRCMCRRWCPGWCKKQASDVDISEKLDQNHQQSPAEEDSHLEAVEAESPPANGSIFTMTLKNNHLIVETEERTDIARNGRETKMKYSPDNEGIFVVEVQQSTAYRPNKPLQNSPPHDPQILSTNQALIHRVPEDIDQKEEERSSEKLNKALALSSTGLSISDLSMSSVGSHNGSYSYGCQMGYEHGPFGYPVYSGYDTSEYYEQRMNHNISQEPLITKTPTDPDKPVVTAAIFKQDSIIGNDALTGPGYCIEGSTDGPLLSDVQAREYSLQHLHDQMDKKLENGVAIPISEKIESPKKVLNRADSLPVRLEEDQAKSIDKNAMETIKEDITDMEVPKDILKGKRASLPIIRTEVYESVKDAIRPSGSPKFEKLQNDTSPGDSSIEAPLITITEESENGKDSSS